MYFTEREIRSYDLELSDNEVEVTLVEIEDCDAIDKVFADFAGFEPEMVEHYKGSWNQFTGDQLKDIHSSLGEFLHQWYEGPKPEDKPKVKTDYEVGMVLSMTENHAYSIEGKMGSLLQIVEIPRHEEAVLKPLNFIGGSLYKGSWSLPSFQNKHHYGLELVEDPAVLNTIENASTQELLAEIQKRIGE